MSVITENASEDFGDEPPDDFGAPDPDVEAEADRDARKWFDLLNQFVYQQLPAIGATHTGKLGAAECDIPREVEYARNAALISALNAMRAMADRFNPPPFLIDTSRFGRDG